MLIYSKKQAQVKAVLFNKALTKILIEYSNYNKVFLVKNVAKFPKNTRINEHTIKLKESK